MTESYLDAIVAARRKQVDEARGRVPLGDLQNAAERRHEWRDFAASLSGESIRVIAEMKKASPSRGLMRRDYRPRELAQGYEAAGAAALSVLTEERHFQGALTDLLDARDAVGLPVLRKDFILDGYQVYESAAGADALLLIVAALSDKDLRNLIELTSLLNLAALVEVHTAEELDRALAAGGRIIGVNNRNLKTLEVDLAASFALRPKIPAHCLAVTESGIRTPQDLKALGEAGYHAALIGERFMTAEDPGRELAAMLGAA
ncbi:MAG: indole-3-glycerol phosphate synthase TrpC [Terriglobia bacterium]